MYSFVNWRKALLPKLGDVIPLGKECDAFQVEPSEQIYYYRYPYKVTLKNHIDQTQSIYDIRRDIVMRKLMLEEFKDRELSSGLRAYISATHQRVYLRSHADLKIMIHFFYPEIDQVTGPVTVDHAKLLVSEDYYCAIRKPYYGKFDVKIYVTAKSGLSDSYMTAWNIKGRKETIMGAKEFLKESIPPQNQKWAQDLYTTSKDLYNVLPFLKLQWPDARLIVTKCIQK